MIYKVTGCKDCPLYDSAHGEYDIWCHHPERPIKILQYAGEAGIWNWPEAKLPNDVFEKIRKENATNGDEFIKKYEKENEISLCVEEQEIFFDKTSNNNCPDWCPLKKEEITIKMD